MQLDHTSHAGCLVSKHTEIVGNNSEGVLDGIWIALQPGRAGVQPSMRQSQRIEYEHTPGSGPSDNSGGWYLPRPFVFPLKGWSSIQTAIQINTTEEPVLSTNR